jgi:glyoxylase I family protein
MSKNPTFNHINLTVGDPARTNAFYRDVLGFETTTDDWGFSFSVGDVMVYVYAARKPLANDRFSEERIGLDHLSFTSPDRASLDAMAAKLIAAGVDTKGVEVFEPTGNYYIAFRDPDNMQLEFWLS